MIVVEKKIALDPTVGGLGAKENRIIKQQEPGLSRDAVTETTRGNRPRDGSRDATGEFGQDGRERVERATNSRGIVGSSPLQRQRMQLRQRQQLQRQQQQAAMLSRYGKISHVL